MAQPCQSPPYIERSRPYRIGHWRTNEHELPLGHYRHLMPARDCPRASHRWCRHARGCLAAQLAFGYCSRLHWIHHQQSCPYRRRFTGRCFGIDLDLHHVQGHEQNAARCVVQVLWRNHETVTRTKVGSDPDEVAMMVDGAQVIIVPGYGMAVSQCQHQVKNSVICWKRSSIPRSSTPFTQLLAECPGT